MLSDVPNAGKDAAKLTMAMQTQEIKGFIKHLKSNNLTPKNTIIGMEATGSYHLALAFLLT